MLSFELKDVLRVSLGLTFVFFLCGTGFLVAALDFPVMETGSRILEKSIPISWTAGVNGQVSVPFQAVEGGDYEVDASPIIPPFISAIVASSFAWNCFCLKLLHRHGAFFWILEKERTNH
jgi:hypothetical protein